MKASDARFSRRLNRVQRLLRFKWSAATLMVAVLDIVIVYVLVALGMFDDMSGEQELYVVGAVVLATVCLALLTICAMTLAISKSVSVSKRTTILPEAACCFFALVLLVIAVDGESRGAIASAFAALLFVSPWPGDGRSYLVLAWGRLLMVLPALLLSVAGLR